MDREGVSDGARGVGSVIARPTSTLRRYAAGVVAITALMLAGCGDERANVRPDSISDGDSVKSPFAHIRDQPPGGKWIAQARNSQNFVREFKGSGTLYLVGVSLARLVSVAYDAEPREVQVGTKYANAYYDVVVRPKDGAPESGREMLRALIGEQLGLEVKRERVKRMCMVLSTAPHAVLLEPSTSIEHRLDLETGRLSAKGSTISQLVELLGKDSKVPVVDETQLVDAYDYLLEWDTRKGAYAFIQALGDIGLKLSPGLRMVESLVVSEAQFLGHASAGSVSAPVAEEANEAP